MLKLTLKFEVTINEIVGSRKLSEVKTYSITDEFNETVGIKEIIDSLRKEYPGEGVACFLSEAKVL